MKQFGQSKTHEFLYDINDIAQNPRLISEIEEDDSYKHAFLRGINESTIRNTLNQIIKNGESTSYVLKIQYGYDQLYGYKEFKFRFDPQNELSSNLNVIIGNNGVGKSRLLRDIALSASNYQPKAEAEFLRNVKLPRISVISDKGSIQEISINNVVYISLSPFDRGSKEFGDFVSQNEKENTDNHEIANYFLQLARENNANESWKQIVAFLNKAGNSYIRKKVLDIIDNNFKWDREISNLLSNIKENLLIDNEEKREKDAEKLKNNFENLSSGQKNILIILTITLENVLENSLLIIDEPENFLHPPYISCLIKSLAELLKSVNGAGIIATHSDITLQEIPSECVQLLDENHDLQQLKRFQTYGASLSDINEQIFGLDMEKTGFYQKMREISENKELAEKLLNNGQLGSEAQLYLSILINEE